MTSGGIGGKGEMTDFQLKPHGYRGCHSGHKMSPKPSLGISKCKLCSFKS